jgi:hypothetical protein
MIHQIISFCSFTTTRGEQTNNRGRLIVANAHISWGSLQHECTTQDEEAKKSEPDRSLSASANTAHFNWEPGDS